MLINVLITNNGISIASYITRVIHLMGVILIECQGLVVN